MNPLVIGLAKVAVNTVSSLGVGTVVNNAVRMTTPEKVSKLAKVGIIVGGFFLSSMVGDKIGTYAEEEIDKLVKIIKSIKIEKEVSKFNNDIVFETIENAEEVSIGLLEVYKKYGYASVADFFNLCHVDSFDIINNSIGWTKLPDYIPIQFVRNGYMLVLPEPFELIKKEDGESS